MKPTKPKPARVSLDASMVEAMAYKLVPTVPEGQEWFYEMKWDGYRAIGQKTAGGVALFSRQHKSFADPFRDIWAALATLRCKSAVVDGEVVALVDGKPSFQALQASRSRKPDIFFFLFDLLELNGKDYRRQSLTERRALLQSVMPLKLSPELPGSAVALMEGARKLGFEGIVAKRKDSTYEEGERSGAWVKWKAEQQDIFLIGGYVPGSGGFDELVIGLKENDGLRFVARLKNGFMPATCASVMHAIEKLALKSVRSSTCPSRNRPGGGRA
jgi:bifunctional non-homologous end joining protein LigD